jgi:signal transduction histidine kinase
LVQLVTRRSALALYGVLLVLPTVVLGGLLWRQLQDDHDAEMAAVPGEATNAARRLSDAIQKQLEFVIEHEGQRQFYLYKRSYFPVGTILSSLALVPSLLTTSRVPEGIMAWFTYPRGDADESELEVFGGSREQDADWPARRTELERATARLAQSDSLVSPSGETRVGSVRVDPLPLAVAAVNASQEPDPECLKNEREALGSLPNESLDVRISSFNVRFYREADGTPRVVALRSVRIFPDPRFRKMPACFDRLSRGLSIRQGFFIDPDWFFAKLPRSLASTILDPSQEYLAGGPGSLAPFHPGAVLADILPVKAFEFETFNPDDVTYGHMSVVGNTANLDARFRSQTMHFLGVAAMLVLSLATGLALLLRSVRRDLDAAQRTENFVAAVTHELRTPLSAIRMHGEMLREGWVQDEAKRQEYYRRIVRETDRLETMVERVLEKSRLSTTDATPEPGDVNAVVKGLGPALIGSGTESPAKDVVFELASDLPMAQIVPEGVRSIVTNLVENARKYAPVDSRAPGAEPIRVTTLMSDGHPILEVRDRGPGIPREERSRIFDAFYRIGNETTRTAKGTGLGLHLAALHCEGMGAKIQALDRDGGGTVFRVTFERA